MSPNRFKIGDTVCVIGTDGPFLTVEEYDNSYSPGKVCCVWFDTKDRLQHAKFSDELLERVEPMMLQKVN